MTMTPERLAELDAVMAKATLGHWHVFQCVQLEGDTLFQLEARVEPDTLQCVSTDIAGEDDAAAIVALHNAYADLRAMIEAQAATIARGLSIHEREALCGAFLTTTVEAGKCYATLKVKDVTTLHNLHDVLIALRAALTGAA